MNLLYSDALDGCQGAMPAYRKLQGIDGLIYTPQV
jgi:hypothetical protein